MTGGDALRGAASGLLLVVGLAASGEAQVVLRAADTVVASEVPDISATATGDELGRALAIGDFDGDGFGDAAMAAPYWNIAAQSYFNVGRVVVIAGSESGLRPFTTASCEEYYVGDSDSPYDRFGRELAVGDFDADGHDDLAVAAPGADWNGADNEGVVHVFSGSATGLVQAGAGSWLWFTQSDLTGSSSEEDDSFGGALAVGDFDGDGYDDLAVGVPFEDYGDPTTTGFANAGWVHVVFGSSSGLSTGSTRYFSEAGISGHAYGDGEEFGKELAAGDFDADGYDDLVIAAPGENGDEGAVFVLFGSAVGPSQPQVLTAADTGVGFGTAVAAGDLDGDGFDDLVVGEPLWNGQNGRVTRFAGGHAGLTTPGTVYAASVLMQFGAALAVGDLDGDGVEEMVAGAPRTETVYGGGLTNAGRVHVWSDAGGGWIGFDQDTPLVPDAPEVNDIFGTTLAVGDLDGDWTADLLVGVPGEDWLADDVGAATVLYFDSVLIFTDGFESGGTAAW